MARSRNISDLYEKEDKYYKDILENHRVLDSKNPLSADFQELTNAYGTLLDEARIITSVSDRLQNKLNRTHDKLQEQSEEINKINTELAFNNEQLQSTIDELTKVQISRKAATIVIILTVVLFFTSEVLIEPRIEEAFPDRAWVELSLKGVIALMIKPIEYVVEKFLMKKTISKPTHSLSNF